MSNPGPLTMEEVFALDDLVIDFFNSLWNKGYDGALVAEALVVVAAGSAAVNHPPHLDRLAKLIEDARGLVTKAAE